MDMLNPSTTENKRVGGRADRGSGYGGRADADADCGTSSFLRSCRGQEMRVLLGSR